MTQPGADKLPPYAAPPRDYQGPRRSLILSGGGMRVSYQAGAIKALIDAGLCFHHIDSTSGGSLNAAMLLSGLSPDEISERWRTFNLRDSVSFQPLKNYFNVRDLTALGDADGFYTRVFPHFGIDLDAINSTRGIEATFNVCNYERKTNEVIPHDGIDFEMLMAGLSLPVMLPPVHRNGTSYVDSAFLKDANLMEAVRRGADELWLIWCIGNTAEYRGGPFRLYANLLELSANGALVVELERVAELNQRIAAGETVDGRTRPLRVHVIRPEYDLPADIDLYLGHVTAGALIDQGYQDARSYLDRGPDGLQFGPEVIMMNERQPGITFSETMAGGFAMGETDPRAGKERGEEDGTTLTMRANVSIPDLHRFIDDPDHAGAISGAIRYPPLGENLPSSGGAFNLFSPANSPHMTHMAYELSFEDSGRQYYLAGKKEVRDDPGVDLWSDTTTLYTRLHEGGDASGPVVGAGVLTLGPVDLVRLATTIRVMNARSTAEQAATLAEFGRFFFGQLWDSYSKFVFAPWWRRLWWRLFGPGSAK